MMLMMAAARKNYRARERGRVDVRGLREAGRPEQARERERSGRADDLYALTI